MIRQAAMRVRFANSFGRVTISFGSVAVFRRTLAKLSDAIGGGRGKTRSHIMERLMRTTLIKTVLSVALLAGGTTALIARPVLFAQGDATITSGCDYSDKRFGPICYGDTTRLCKGDADCPGAPAPLR